MRTTQFFPVLLAALAMSLSAGAQQSSNYQLKEHDLNAGGAPKDGLALTSTNFKIAVGTFGDCLWATGMGSPNIQLVAGFPATTAPACTLTCTATVPDTGVPGTPVPFASTATPSNCSGSPTYDWDFGDGTPHSSAQSPSHTYASAGAYTWTFTAAAGGLTCTKTGTITAVNPPVITLMKKVAPPFKIVVTGTNLQSGIRVFIDGAEWTSVMYKKSIKIQLTGGASLKAAVPKGVPKTFRFLNPDGGEASMTWSW